MNAKLSAAARKELAERLEALVPEAKELATSYAYTYGRKGVNYAAAVVAIESNIERLVKEIREAGN